MSGVGLIYSKRGRKLRPVQRTLPSRPPIPDVRTVPWYTGGKELLSLPDMFVVVWSEHS